MRPLELMLTRWLELYPELMGIYEDDPDHRAEARRIRGLFVTPLLQSPDLAATFAELRVAYREWKESRSIRTPGPQEMLHHEDRLGDRLAAIMEEHQDELGERVVRAIRGATDLRGIIRWSVIPYEETWPEESWPRIGRLMSDGELCLAAILEYLATGAGLQRNVEPLASWAFQYAREAYQDAGFYAQESTRLEDIPE